MYKIIYIHILYIYMGIPHFWTDPNDGPGWKEIAFITAIPLCSTFLVTLLIADSVKKTK